MSVKIQRSGIRKFLSLRIFIAVWSFLAGALFATYYHDIRFGIRYIEAFTTLEFTKEPFGKPIHHHDLTIVFYRAERGKNPVKIQNAKLLETTVRNAIDQFGPFMKRSYGLSVPKSLPRQTVSVIFTGPEIYQRYDDMQPEGTNAHFLKGLPFFSRAYIKCFGDTCNIKHMAGTIRHELFHVLTRLSGIEETKEFNEEKAAGKFSM
ncbi:MAG: hypothetical protein Q8Q39_00585 [bacterium]|nr:hypothetical protein [bacterium]